ncbi:hypothetical protein R6Z07F_011921 [Ovis aries]
MTCDEQKPPGWNQKGRTPSVFKKPQMLHCRLGCWVVGGCHVLTCCEELVWDPEKQLPECQRAFVKRLRRELSLQTPPSVQCSRWVILPFTDEHD